MPRKKWQKVYKAKFKDTGEKDRKGNPVIDFDRWVLVMECQPDDVEEKGFHPDSGERIIEDTKKFGIRFSGEHNIVTQTIDGQMFLYSNKRS